MAQIRHLDHAPIAEAVIELRVRPAGEIRLETLHALAERWKVEYPVKETVNSLEAKLGIEAGTSRTETRVQQIGLRLKTSDQREVVQFRSDAFAYSRLEPYTSWDDVLPRANRVWNSYLDSLKPVKLVRLGVRYINRLRLPLPVDVEMYLSCPPAVPEMLPPAIKSFLTRTLFYDAEAGNSVTITQASEPSIDQNQLVILLDVDAFRGIDIDPDDSQIIPMLESLRELKNRAFFGSITERTAERYA